MKVLVGCPTCDLYEYCLDKYVDAVKNLDYKDYDVVLVDNSKNKEYTEKIKKLGLKVIKGKYYDDVKRRIIESRNLLRQYALDNNYDYLLSLEQDVIPPKDIINKLASHGDYIVTGVYFNYNINNGVKMLTPMLWKSVGGEDVVYISEDEVFSKDYFSVIACGLGCVLISREVLGYVEFRFAENEKCYDDMFFGLDVHNKGYSIFVDTSVRCVHLINDKKFDLDKI